MQVRVVPRLASKCPGKVRIPLGPRFQNDLCRRGRAIAFETRVRVRRQNPVQFRSEHGGRVGRPTLIIKPADAFRTKTESES